MITRDEILMGRDKEFPLNGTLESNLQKLLTALNKFRTIYGKPMKVSSGYRPGKYNKAAGGATKSNHMICMACDFIDIDSSLDSFCVANQHVLEECGLYLEHPKWTNTWCHLDIFHRKRHIFIPSDKEPTREKLDNLFIDLKI